MKYLLILLMLLPLGVTNLAAQEPPIDTAPPEPVATDDAAEDHNAFADLIFKMVADLSECSNVRGLYFADFDTDDCAVCFDIESTARSA